MFGGLDRAVSSSKPQASACPAWRRLDTVNVIAPPVGLPRSAFFFFLLANPNLASCCFLSTILFTFVCRARRPRQGELLGGPHGHPELEGGAHRDRGVDRLGRRYLRSEKGLWRWGKEGGGQVSARKGRKNRPSWRGRGLIGLDWIRSDPIEK